MIPHLREKFNSEYKQETYNNFLTDLNTILKYPVDFRVAETPIFLPDKLKSEIIIACNSLLEQIRSDNFKDKSREAIPKEFEVQNTSDHPEFLQIDFAICKNADGSYVPKLIELQGFPSVYSYQFYLYKLFDKYYNIDNNLSPYFSSLDDDTYKQKLRNIIVGDTNPENVILLEIQPEKQKTRIDFSATEELFGITSVCISEVIQEGKKLYYKKANKQFLIERIYNRVIFDEVERNDVSFSFNFRDELDVKWVAHPNWFYLISKYSLPMLKGECVPDCFFLNNLNTVPDDLTRFVLKPLFSFAGHGVDVDITKEKLETITDPENYILQQKIEYAPVIKTPDEYSKVEIRMMFFWDEEPLLVNNLVRMSKGKMMGVDFNKNKTWVGSSLALHY
ncbi:MAG: hypothetical protein O6940_12975 [Ignavibacteria bacterium]|nr:hypothetical protein [Ignavibacteria bacterium]